MGHNKDKAVSYLLLALFIGSTAFPELAHQFPGVYWLTVASTVSGCLYRAFSYAKQNDELKDNGE